MPTRNTIFLYTKNDSDSLKKKKELTSLIKAYGFQMEEDHNKASIIVSVGTDATFLQAVRKTGFRQDCLYAGISVKDGLHMYCDFCTENLDEMAEALLSRNIEVRKYPLLEASVNNQPKLICLNDFSIRSNIITPFVLEVLIDGKKFETFRGDGMVISTPTGSSGYNKSLSGAIVDPLIPCFQVAEIASINNNEYRSLGSSFILSGNRTLTLNLLTETNSFPSMSADNEALSVQHVKTVHIKLSKNIIKTVKMKNNSYWDKVKRSFL